MMLCGVMVVPAAAWAQSAITGSIAGEVRDTWMFDVHGGLGGPIIKDKLWFYDAHRRMDTVVEQANVYYNKLQGLSPFPAVSSTLFYEPDLNHPGYVPSPQREFLNLRVTWQAASKHKIAVTGGCPAEQGGSGRAGPAAAKVRHLQSFQCERHPDSEYPVRPHMAERVRDLGCPHVQVRRTTRLLMR
jgi:hypothetical protein